MARLVTEINRALAVRRISVRRISDCGMADLLPIGVGCCLIPSRLADTLFRTAGLPRSGYGLPGAIGVALAAPGKVVLSLTGDGGFNMVLGELETARRLNLTFTMIVVNNAASGYVKALQHLVYGPGSYHASDLSETNYAAAAQALGSNGIRVEDPADLAAALAKSLKLSGPTVLDVVVTRDPAKMLPGVDNRAVKIKKGDRVA